MRDALIDMAFNLAQSGVVFQPRVGCPQSWSRRAGGGTGDNIE